MCIFIKKERVCFQLYTSMFHAASSIMKHEGMRGFYRGLSASCLGVAPQMGLQFGFYALLQNFWNSTFNLPQGHHPGMYL